MSQNPPRATAELSVSVRQESQSFRGLMVDTGPASVEVDFPILTAPSLPMDACTNLVIAGRGLERPVAIPGQVTYREDGTQRRRYRFQIDYEGGMALANVFNRRKSLRVPLDMRVNVAMQLQGIVAPVDGVLRDVSRDGASVRVETTEEERLYETESLSMSFVLPGSDERVLMMGVVRHRTLGPKDVHYGIEFLSQPTEAFRTTVAMLDTYVEARQSQLLQRFSCTDADEAETAA